MYPEAKVKRALGSITMNKASGPDGIPAELFQILKDDAVKVLYSIGQQIWKTQQRPLNWKRSLFISIPKKGNSKECSNYCTTVLISHASKVMLKILQARLQQYLNPCTSWMQKRWRSQRLKCQHLLDHRKREFQKNIYFCFIDYAKVFWLCGLQKTVENSSRDGNTRPPHLPPEKPVCRSSSNS